MPRLSESSLIDPSSRVSRMLGRAVPCGAGSQSVASHHERDGAEPIEAKRFLDFGREWNVARAFSSEVGTGFA
jgi:hypothetical protein